MLSSASLAMSQEKPKVCGITPPNIGSDPAVYPASCCCCVLHPLAAVFYTLPLAAVFCTLPLAAVSWLLLCPGCCCVAASCLLLSGFAPTRALLADWRQWSLRLYLAYTGILYKTILNTVLTIHIG